MEKEKLPKPEGGNTTNSSGSHKITITSIMGMVVEDTDAMVTGMVSSTTNMLLSILS